MKFQPDAVKLIPLMWASVLVAFVLCLPLSIPATAVAFDSVSLNTFGTIGGVVLDDDEMTPQRSLGRVDTFNGRASWQQDSMLGFQADATVDESFGAHLQLVFKERTDNNFDEHIEWAYFDWKLTPVTTFRVGRLGADFYMLSDYRNVSYAYLWQRPPVEFYAPVIVQNYDGMDIRHSWRMSQWTLALKAYWGMTESELIIDQQQPVSHAKLEPFFGGSLNLENLNWRISAGYAHTTLDSEFESLDNLVASLNNPVVGLFWPEASALSEKVATKGKDITFYSLGSSYEVNDWVLQAEIGYMDSEWELLIPIKSAYLSIGKQIGSYTPYLLIAKAESDGAPFSVASPTPGSPADVNALYAGLEETLKLFLVDQKTVSLGFRKDLGPNLALKAQWDHTWIENDGALLNWGLSEETEIDAFSVSLNWMLGL